jgi:hypothetical protein
MMSLWRHKDRSESGGVTAGELGHSQYGTPLGEIIHADPHYDPQKWLILPTNWADSGGRWSGPGEWAAARAPLVWGAWVELTPGAEHPGPEAVGRTKLELERYGDQFGGFDPSRPFEVVTYLYLPDPRNYSLPVHVWVDDRPDLTVEQATADVDAIDPPVIEDFSFQALGIGRKSLSHGVQDPRRGDLPGTQGVWVTVRYAFAVPGRHAIVTVKATETDPAGMTAAAADLDEFAASITLSFANNTPYVIDGAGSPPNIA